MSLHQDIYQKILNCFSNYIPIDIIPIILDDEDIDLVTEEKVNKDEFEKSDTEIYESTEELKYPLEFENAGTIVLNDSKKEINDPRVQAMFKLVVIITYLFS